MSEAPVRRAGNYVLLHPLGVGGFGTVWRAELQGASGFRKPVAIKLLNAKGASDPDLARRLRDEARVLGMIRHRAVVGVDDLVRVGDRWAVVMEYVSGADLEHLLGQGPLPPRVAAELAREVAWALDAAHGARHPDTGAPLSVVHRDVKPANLRLTERGEVKVLDFGIARARFDAREAATSAMRFGTPGYIAPERYDGEDSPAGDVFSLGLVLLEALSGRAPGQLPVRPAPFQRALDPHLDALPEALAPLRDLIRRMTSYTARDRPKAGEVARELQDIAPRLEGPWLVDWAAHNVRPDAPPRAPAAAEGADATWGFLDLPADSPRPGTLVPSSGELLRVNPTLIAADPTSAPLARRPVWLLVLIAALALAIVAALLL